MAQTHEVESNSSYLIVISMIGLMYIMEKVAMTVFLFPHLVDDINRESAQKNFAVAQIIYWVLSLVMDVVAGKFAEKTGYSHPTLLVAVFCKTLYLYIYVCTKDVSLLMTCIALAGFSNYLYALSIAEIKKYTNDQEIIWWLNFAVTLSAVGGVLASIIRMTPTNFKVDLYLFTITQGTICMFILANLYFIYLPCLACMKLRVSTIRETEASVNRYTGDRWMKVFAASADVFCATLVWDVSTISCAEMAKRIQVSDYLVSAYLIIRYIVSGLSTVVWSRISSDCSSTTLTIFMSGRQAAVTVMFISSLLPSKFATFVLLLCSDMMLSILHFFDYIVLMKELWKLSSGDATTITALVFVGRNLGYVFGCFVPLCFNFIGLVYASILTILVVTQWLLMKTSLI